MNIRIVISLMGILMLVSCSPDRDDDFHLPSPPDSPQFSIQMVPGDSSRIVIMDLSDGNFQRLWELPGGTPKISTRQMDTIFYSKAGGYKITLFVSKTDGSGTASASQNINILIDAPVSCTPKFALLTGDCDPLGKCWVFTHMAGAVKVGPTYDDFSWYTSPVNGLQAEQYDDRFCFTFEGLVFQNKNNGASIDPWDGYNAKPYNPGVSEFTFIEGSGINGRDQIIIPDDQFMGVWDSDNVLDIVLLTETELTVRGRQRAQDGTPLPEGWFELVFIAQ